MRRRRDCYYNYRSNSYRFDSTTSLPPLQAILAVALDTHRNPILPPPSTTPSWTCPNTPGGAAAVAGDCSRPGRVPAAGTFAAVAVAVDGYCDCSATVAV